jgi:hypothetical protein
VLGFSRHCLTALLNCYIVNTDLYRESNKIKKSSAFEPDTHYSWCPSILPLTQQSFPARLPHMCHLQVWPRWAQYMRDGTGWIGWAMAHPIFQLGWPQCIWPTQKFYAVNNEFYSINNDLCCNLCILKPNNMYEIHDKIPPKKIHTLLC